MDIALKYGFENHETFSRAFKSTYGMTPDAYRNNPIRLTHCFIPDLSLKYELVDENVPLIADGIVLEVKNIELTSPKLYAGHSIQNRMGDDPGPDLMGDLWDRIHEEKPSIPALKADGQEIGVSLPGEQPDCFTYFAGAEIEDDSNLDSKFKVFTLTEGRYIVCSFEAENFFELTSQAINKARDYLFCTWLPSHKINTEPFMAEIYYEENMDTSFMQLWVKIAD